MMPIRLFTMDRSGCSRWTVFRTSPRGPLAGVRVGPRLELGGSFVIDNGAKVVGLADPAGVPQFRLGGLEMSLGLELSLQFSVASKASRRSSKL